MKKILSKILLFLLVNLYNVDSGWAQNIVDYSQVGLMKADYDHRAVVYLGDSQKAATAILGTPSAVGTYFSQMANLDLVVLSYGGNKLYFDPHGLVAYNIVDAGIAVGKTFATSFRVGSNRGSNALFYGIYLETTSGKSRNLSYSSIAFASIKSGGTVLDCGVEVLFDANGNVFNIHLSEN